MKNKKEKAAPTKVDEKGRRKKNTRLRNVRGRKPMKRVPLTGRRNPRPNALAKRQLPHKRKPHPQRRHFPTRLCPKSKVVYGKRRNARPMRTQKPKKVAKLHKRKPHQPRRLLKKRTRRQKHLLNRRRNARNGRQLEPNVPKQNPLRPPPNEPPKQM